MAAQSTHIMGKEKAACLRRPNGNKWSKFQTNGKRQKYANKLI